MKLKFGKYIFNEWYYYNKSNMWGRLEIHCPNVYILIRHQNEHNVCEIQLGYGMNFIAKCFDQNLLKNGTIPGTADEVKEKIDAFS